MTPQAGNGKCILVAEDEQIDAFILEEAFRKLALPARLMIVRDGQEAVNYLSGHGCYADRHNYPVPRLVVLDLKMPRMDGFDVLAWLAERPEFKALPRIILSSSSHESDMQRARQLGAAHYYVKPNSLQQLSELLQDICRRWLVAPPTSPLAPA
jgi:CheY-like chemotaxis protein